MSKKFHWWWEDPKDLALWQEFRDIPYDQLRNEVDPDIYQAITEMWGGLYWWRPYEDTVQLDVHNSLAMEILDHGNNNSGKSLTIGARVGYEVIGFSPTIHIYSTKYGTKKIWVFSPDKDIQRSSAQEILFATDSIGNIGLLPPFTTIRKYGGRVVMGEKGCINFVQMPDTDLTPGALIEFKSEEMSVKNLQAAGVDIVWFDEKPRDKKLYDETTARIIRKQGKVFMSYIVEDAHDEDEGWPAVRYERESLEGLLTNDQMWVDLDELVRDIGNPEASKELPEVYHVKDNKVLLKEYFFTDIYDNKSLSDVERELALRRFDEQAKHWRFSKGGRFAVIPVGDKVHPGFNIDLHAVPNLLNDTFDPLIPIYESYDLGKECPVCIGFQVDQFGARNYLYCIVEHNMYLTHFLERVQGERNRLVPNYYGVYILYPHDGNRKSDVSAQSARDVFRKHGERDNLIMIYNQRDTALEIIHAQFNKLQDGKHPVIKIDDTHASSLIKCCLSHKLDKHGKPQEKHPWEDVTDAFMRAELYCSRNVGTRRNNVLGVPNYSGNLINVKH